MFILHNRSFLAWLRLSPAEERHLFLLAHGEIPVQKTHIEEPVTPAMQRVLDALSPHPAFLIGVRWNVLA